MTRHPLIFNALARFQKLALTTITAALILTVGLIPTPALAETPPKSPVEWAQLNLNATQKNAINSLDKQWQQTYLNIQPKIEADRAKLRQMLDTPQPNETEVMNLQHQLQSNHETLHMEATRIFMKKKHQLNPEQKKKFRQMMHNHAQHEAHGHH